MLGTIYFPHQPEDALSIRFKLSSNDENRQSYVDLNSYSGEVLRVDNFLKMSLGLRILNYFTLLHYGAFGGLPTRILYVFVGFAPLSLFVSGFAMWRYRYRSQPSVRHRAMEPSQNLPNLSSKIYTSA